MKILGICCSPRPGGTTFTMMCHDMICVSDGRPTAHFGATAFSGIEGGIEQDVFGHETAEHLGRRVAEVAVRIHA